MLILRLLFIIALTVLIVSVFNSLLSPIWSVLALMLFMTYAASTAYMWRVDLYNEFYASDPVPAKLESTVAEQLDAIAEGLQIEIPEIYVTHHDFPLLLSLVATTKDRAILISEAMLDTLEDHEKVAVFAHEFAHIAKGHTSRYTLLITFFAALNLPLVARALLSDFLGAENRAWLNKAANWMNTLFMPIFYLWLPVFVSKKDDFEADIEAVKATNDPIALINAINKFEACARKIAKPEGPLARTSSFFFFTAPIGFSDHLAVIPSLDERRWKLLHHAKVEDVQDRSLGW
jgi:Zn-dependent protease with chaperone function